MTFVTQLLLSRVTILRDKATRMSRGVAFIQYKSKDLARKCVAEVNGEMVNTILQGSGTKNNKNLQIAGRTIKASIAKDNGKGGEYQERRTYNSNNYCFECREEGHVSYKCPKNVLGVRDPPTKKQRLSEEQRGIPSRQVAVYNSNDNDEQSFDFNYDGRNSQKRIKYKKNCYFSDEEEEAEIDD